MVEINLLPQQYRKQSQPDVWKYASVGAAGVTLLTLGVMWMLTNQNVRQLQGQIDSVQGDITALTPQKEKHDALVTQQQDLEKVTAVAQTLKGNKTYWSNDMAAFSREIPMSSGVALTNMLMKDTAAPAQGQAATQTQTAAQPNSLYDGKVIRRELTISGTAISQQAVINFLRTFENSPNFGVNFKGMQQDEKTGMYTFDATVGIVGEAPASATASGNTTPTNASGTTTAPATPAPAAPAAPASPAGGS